MNETQAYYAFGEEKLSWTPKQCREQIKLCRIEIKKYNRSTDTMWKIYHKELTNLHALLKYLEK